MASVSTAAVCTNAGYNGNDISGRVNATGATTNSGCQVGNSSSPHPNPQAKANADALFGFTDWVMHPNGNPFQTPNSTSGSYTLPAGFFTTYDRALFMFQSDNADDSAPGNYVAYLLLAANGTTGTWTSPFDDEDSWDQPYKKKVAAIKLLYHLAPTGGPSPVPLPAPILLLGLALGGLGVGRWWKNRRAASRVAAQAA